LTGLLLLLVAPTPASALIPSRDVRAACANLIDAYWDCRRIRGDQGRVHCQQVGGRMLRDCRNMERMFIQGFRRTSRSKASRARVRRAAGKKKRSRNKVCFEYINYAVNSTGFHHPAVIRGVLQNESGGNPKAYAYSKAAQRGHHGCGQIDKAIAKKYGVTDIYDPRQNTYASVAYLRYLTMKYYNGDPIFGVAAYNVGPGRVPYTGDYCTIPNLGYVRAVFRVAYGQDYVRRHLSCR